MEKVNYKVGDLLKQKLEIIRQWYPNVIEENKNGLETINLDALKIAMNLDFDILEQKTENYIMSWPDKIKTNAQANLPTDKVLRPLLDKSVNFFNTKNIYIEGDNLDALKILYSSYLNKIDVIYIDPPYNTGNDFIYNDNFTQDKSDALLKEGKIDELNNRLEQNSKTKGRFHTNWLNMIYPRLKIARDFLNEEGMIFISIDDNEQANLKKVCDEIYGEENFISNIVWQKKNDGSADDSLFLKNLTEYILVYAKNANSLKMSKMQRDVDDGTYIYEDKHLLKRGKFKLNQLDRSSLTWSKSLDYSFEHNGITYYPGGVEEKYLNRQNGKHAIKDWRWRWSLDKLKWGIENDMVVFKNNKIYTKQYQYVDNNLEKQERISPFSNLILNNNISGSSGTDELRKHFDNDKVFDHPKPTKLIEFLIKLHPKKDALVMDFFSGSGTTAETVLKINAQDKSFKLNFILVQLNENKIIENAQLRIKKVLEKNINNNALNNENEINDLGFRVFKIDSNNIIDYSNNVENTNQDLFSNLISNFYTIKKDRNDLDLVFQSILDCRLMLSKDINIEKFNNKNIFYNINNNFLICCFENKIDDIEFLKYLANLKPSYIYFKERSFENDQIKINLEEIFKNYSRDTVIKVF